MASKTDERDEMIAIRLPADLLSKVRMSAKANERSLSAEVRLALKHHVKEDA